MSLIDGIPHLVKAELRLGNGRVAQSFAGGGTSLYVSQVSIGGDRAGHLLITRVDMRTWARTGLMRLRGAGHGVSIGLDAGGWLWAECGPVTHVQGSARGSRITRAKFGDGRRIARGSLVLDPPGNRCTPSVDIAARELAVRSWDGTRYLWRRYSLDAALEGNFALLSGPHQLGADGLMQGWCLHAGHIYAVLGETVPTLVDLDLATGRTTTHPLSLHVGEPEGVAVIDAQLWFGIATGRPGSRRLNLYRMEMK